MSEIFGFDLPDKSKELTDKEYVNLVNRIRGNFLSYVVKMLEHIKKLEILTRKIREKSHFLQYNYRLN